MAGLQAFASRGGSILFRGEAGHSGGQWMLVAPTFHIARQSVNAYILYACTTLVMKATYFSNLRLPGGYHADQVTWFEC